MLFMASAGQGAAGTPIACELRASTQFTLVAMEFVFVLGLEDCARTAKLEPRSIQSGFPRKSLSGELHSDFVFAPGAS